MAPKRMSVEEKRQTILDIYHKTKQVYTEKEILTLAAQAGVNANTIAEINNSLVDDGLVDKEKIAGSNYFWSFPSKQDRKLQMQHQETLSAIERLREQLQQAESELADAKRGREEDADTTTCASETTGTMATTSIAGMSRAAKLQRLQEIEQARIAYQQELAVLKENDPQALADLEKELQLCKEAANRWTDNIFNCKTYLTKKRGMDKKEAMRILNITSAFDYPEDKIPK